MTFLSRDNLGILLVLTQHNLHDALCSSLGFQKKASEKGVLLHVANVYCFLYSFSCFAFTTVIDICQIVTMDFNQLVKNCVVSWSTEIYTLKHTQEKVRSTKAFIIFVFFFLPAEVKELLS